MKNFFKFKNIISLFIFIPCVFFPISHKNSNLENNLIKNFSFGKTSSNISNQKNLIGYFIEEISLGETHSAATITNGTTDYLYTWGHNNVSQTGIEVLNPLEEYEIPTKVTNLSSGNIKQISMGGDHSAAIVDDVLYTWGENGNGQLGLGFDEDKLLSTLNISTPWPVSSFTNYNVDQISMGYKHSAAIVSDDENEYLYTWGANSVGQLGLGWENNPDDTIKYYSSPQKINPPEGDDIKIEQISLGYDYSAAIINDGTSDELYTWGENSQGQLGVGDKENKSSPTKVKDLPDGDIEQIALGNFHSAAIVQEEDGKDHLYTWGKNSQGQLGLGDNIDYDTPQEVTNLPEGDIKQIALGGFHANSKVAYSAVIINTAEGDQLWTWGSNQFGQLGLGNNNDYNTPQEVTNLLEGDIKQVSLGGYHSGVVIHNKKGDHFYTWGSNQYGQLGYGENYKKSAEYYNDDKNIPYYSSPHQIFEELYDTWFLDYWYYFLILFIVIIIIWIFIVILIIKRKKLTMLSDK